MVLLEVCTGLFMLMIGGRGDNISSVLVVSARSVSGKVLVLLRYVRPVSCF